jgi:hypothetical protein
MFRAMKTRRPAFRLIALLCVMALQVQAWAAASPSCRRNTTHAGAAHAGCLFHHGSREPAPSGWPSAPFGCHKCMLKCGLGLYHPVTSGIQTARAVTLSESTALPEHHFYWYAPDPLLRPPIASPVS